MCLLQPPSAPFVRMALLVLLMTIMDYPHAQIIKLFLYQKPLEAKVKIKIEYTVAQSSKNPYRHQVFGRNPDRNAKALDVHDIPHSHDDTGWRSAARCISFAAWYTVVQSGKYCCAVNPKH